MLSTRFYSITLVTLLFLVCPDLHSQETGDDEMVQKLVEAGFVNVRTAETANQRIYTIENDAYKLQASGVAKALQILDAEHSDDGKICKVIVTDYNVPQVTLTYDPSVGRWNTTYRLDESWDRVKYVKRAASSVGNVDLVIYPQVSLMNLIITQVYQSLWQVSPALEVSLWPGAKFTAQLKIPVFNDGYEGIEDRTHPGFITLSQRLRLPGNVFTRVTAGIMGTNRFGVDLDVRYPLPNERFYLFGELAYLGASYFQGYNYYYIPDMYWYWNFGGSYYMPALETQFSLMYAQFVYGDRGFKYEMIRHFRFASIGFYAEKGRYSQFNGGFRFQVALPPYRAKRYGKLPRVTTSGQMGLVYNTNNERYFYKEYKVEASDNIMEKNGFNPYFIQSEINKLNY